jgi:hypothetical protein
MGLWPSKSNKQLDPIVKAVLNSVGLCDAEIYTWLYKRNMQTVEEEVSHVSMMQAHTIIMNFFLSLVFLNLSKRLSESRSRALFNDLKNKVVPKGASMLGLPRASQKIIADVVFEHVDASIESYRPLADVNSPDRLVGLAALLAFHLWQLFEASLENKKRAAEFGSAIIEVVKAGIARTNLLKLVEDID